MQSLSGDFDLDVNVTKIEKKELLSLENPYYKDVLEKHSHLRGVRIDDDYDKKELLPIHLILGANDCAKIRTSENLRVGRSGEPVAEHTKFGWSIMSPGTEQEVSLGCLAVNSVTDYNNLCSLDVLGLADTTGHGSNVLGEFKEQLTRSEEGWYGKGCRERVLPPTSCRSERECRNDENTNCLRRVRARTGKYSFTQ